jgi:hypothetical protein
VGVFEVVPVKSQEDSSKTTRAFNEGIKTGEEKGRENYLVGWCLICPTIRIAFCYHPDSALFVPIVESVLQCTSKSLQYLIKYITSLRNFDPLCSTRCDTRLDLGRKSARFNEY